MDCAFDDHQINVVAMVDFAISAQFGLGYCKKLLSSPKVLIVELSNFNTGFYMVTSLWIVLLMTIKPLWSLVVLVDFAFSEQFGLIYSKNS